MGWTIEDIWKGPLRYAEEKRRVESHYTFDMGNGITVRPVHVSNSRPAWYVAAVVTIPAGVEHDPAPYRAETLADGSRRYVFAEVMLTRNTSREWGYKCICEASGPVEAKAPLSLLDKLSEVQDGPRTETPSWAQPGYTCTTRIGSALDWRDRCREYHFRNKRARALKPGQRIKLHHAATFGQSDPVDSFEVVDPTAYGFRKVSYPVFKTPSGAICRLRPDTLAAGFTVLS